MPLSTSNPDARIRPAAWPGDLPAARHLLERYLEDLRANPSLPAAVRDKHREAELNSLPETYTGEAATLLLAHLGGRASGVVAVRLLREREGAAELKRLFVLPEARGRGLAAALIHSAATWARQKGARELLLDTVPAAMPGAVQLYRSLGFEPTDRYNGSEGCCFAFFRLPLA